VWTTQLYSGKLAGVRVRKSRPGKYDGWITWHLYLLLEANVSECEASAEMTLKGRTLELVRLQKDDLDVLRIIWFLYPFSGMKFCFSTFKSVAVGVKLLCVTVTAYSCRVTFPFSHPRPSSASW
jgi:hypothetical protein